MSRLSLCLVVSLSAFSLAGCAASKAAGKREFDFSKIRRVSVALFEGQHGRAAADELIKKLVGTGLEVTDARHPGNAVLVGVVTEYKPDDQRIVFLGDTTLMAPGGQTVVVKNPVVSLGSAQITAEGAVVGIPNAQIGSVTATVGVMARLVDASSGRTLWEDRYTYEGLDPARTLEAVVGRLARSLSRVLPQMNKRAS